MITKYLKKQLDSRSWPCIIRCKEKHGDVCYIASSKEDVFKIALAVLKRRKKEGFYYAPSEPKYELEVHSEIFDRLPPEMQKDAQRRKDRNEYLRREFAEDSRIWTELNAAVKDNDGETAFQIIYDRGDHEYEGFEFVTPVKVP